MKTNDRYQPYCTDIAELFLNLEEAEERVKDWNHPELGLQRRILKRIGLHADFPPRDGEEQERWLQGVKERKRWLQSARAATKGASQIPRRASKPGVFTKVRLGIERARGDEKATVEGYENREARRERLAEELVASPWLLNCLLHALDRGDETYFLYLTRKVTEISDWLSEHKLVFFNPAADSRIPEAWPWQDPIWEGRRECLRQKRVDARQELKKTVPEVDGFKGEEARCRLQRDVDNYFDFSRKWEFLSKIKAWEKAEQTKLAAPGESPSLEKLVYSIFVEGKTGKYTSASELAELLFRSPKEQSKLALLLGLPPSRWLIEEEHDSIAARRVLELDIDSAKTSAVPPSTNTIAPGASKSSTPPDQVGNLAPAAVKPPGAYVNAAAPSPNSGGVPETDQRAVQAREDATNNAGKDEVGKDEVGKDKPVKRSMWDCPEPVAEPQDAKGDCDSKRPSVPEPADVRDKIGLCFSGGGIRSATFNLGVLQALAELNLLSWVNYLSTVSGGGYIHQWVAAWWRRATESAHSKTAFQTVNKALVAQPDSVLPGIEPTQISFLRRFSNYLTPEKGALSADTWTLVAIWVRNTFLNQLVLLLGFLMLFGVLRLMLIGLEEAAGRFSYRVPVRAEALISLAVFLFLVFAVFVLWQVRTFSKNLDSDAAPTSSDKGNGWIAGAISLLLLAALLYTVICAGSIFTVRFPAPASTDALKAWLYYAVLWSSLKAVLFLLCPASLAWLVMEARARFANLLAYRQTAELKPSWLVRLGNLFRALLATGLALLVLVCICLLFLTGIILPSADEALVLILALVLMGWPLLIAFAGFTPKLYRQAFPNMSRNGMRLPVWMVTSAILAGGIVMTALALTFWTLDHKLPDIWSNEFCASKNHFVQALVYYAQNHPNIWMDLLFLSMPPVLVAALFLASVFHAGLNKHMFRDESLEWAARLRAWGFLLSLAWVALLGCLILSAPLLHASLSFGWTSAAATLWAAISGGGALAGKSKSTSSDSRWQALGKQALLQIAPYVFVAGFFVIVSLLVNVVTDHSLNRLEWLISISAVLFAVYGWNVDINEFSMHSFYRNRLARCYQGASVVDRRPDAFTGFSRDDRAIRLGELRIRRDTPDDRSQYPGPFPIFCCTANFTTGEDLAWQERKGASFAYTPLYSGYDVPWTGLDEEKTDQELSYNGYRDTFDLGHPNGPGLADVAAISGAAVSPTWGYHTSPAIAFLLTCFNVRLGVWMRNTRRTMRSDKDRKTGAPSRDTQSPRFAPAHLLMELFGQANDKSTFLYLSDGGHFDNMGLYELVRRECKYIVVCDAEEDGNITFEGMAMALRKCRSDFGVEIDLDLRAMRKASETGQSGVHCVVGTILYPNEDPETPGRDRGKIVYMKSTLTGKEPADLLSYKLEHQAFPHDSTGDQWFSESQFESYRVLGRSIAVTALKPACTREDSTSSRQEKCRTFFNRLYDIWYPVTPTIERHLSDHGAQFDSLLRELRSKNTIAAHANEIFKTGAVDLLSKATAADKQYFKAFALSLFDFMWRVFNDLDLQIASNRAHPQGEIWMNTFKRWTEMKFVREIWPIYRDRYPASFHFFLVEHLNFKDTDDKRFETP